SHVIVVVTPCLDGFARLGEREEDVLVEAFVAQAAIEALDEGVLQRLARLDVVPVEPPGGPAQDYPAPLRNRATNSTRSKDQRGGKWQTKSGPTKYSGGRRSVAQHW